MLNLRWELVPYFRGKILEISAGEGKAFPHFISYKDAQVKDAHRLEMFASKSLDGVLSCHILNQISYESACKSLKEWSRVVKEGGYIILYLPKEGKWEVNYESVTKSLDCGWDLVQYEEWDSLLFVFKLGKGKNFSWKNPKPEKTCGIVRLGAFGDMLMTSSIFPWLKSHGFHVTLYCSDHGYPVVKHDPHIDRFILQGRDEVPPELLGEFWDYTKKKYEKWINLSESVEGTLLATPGRTNHSWPDSVRAKYMDVNYVEFTHELAEVPPPYQPKFYSTLEERAWARKQVRGNKNIIWSLSGSSVHKTWPHLDAVIARLMLDTDVHVYLVGDEMSQILEAGWGQEPRVHCKSGKWSIRESMAFCEVADLIIGTETGLLNAAGSMDTPKIVTLSHSSEEMLTKHWRSVTALKQESGCPKFPCRMLHYTWEHCMKHEETGTAVCQQSISAETMFNAISKVLNAN